MNPQLPFAHEASEFAGTGHEVHKFPQDVRAVFNPHRPEQLCEPLGQTPVQAALLAMQAPAHALCPEGQLAPQDFPSQLALPPTGAGHGVQPAPQWSAELFATHALSHWCVSLGHWQAWLTQLPPVGQSAEVQQAVLEMHSPAHSRSGSGHVASPPESPPAAACPATPPSLVADPPSLVADPPFP
ncbi:MAG: hypothetical protein ABI548_15715 [Polyangiaceae bacterium]